VRYGQGINYAFHEIDSSEAAGTPARRKRRIWAISRAERGILSGSPDRQYAGSPHRNGAHMESLGIQIEAHHHEVATGGQNEIDMRFTTLTRMADNLMIYKITWSRIPPASTK